MRLPEQHYYTPYKNRSQLPRKKILKGVRKLVDGAKIRRMREARGLTTVKFGEEIKASNTMVTHIELGIKPPSVSLLERIAAYFNVTVDYLLFERDNSDKSTNTNTA